MIDHTGLFEFAARFGGRPALRAGEYVFKAHASISDALDTIATGRQVQHALAEQVGPELLAGDVALQVDQVAVPPDEAAQPIVLFEDELPFGPLLVQGADHGREELPDGLGGHSASGGRVMG